MTDAGKDLYPEYFELIRCEVEIRQDWSGLSGQNPASDSNAAVVRDAYEPVEDEPAQVNPDIPVAVPPTQRKPVDDNRGNLFLPDIPAEPQTASTPKAASTDRREAERKPKNDADKSDAERLLDVWEQKYPYEMHHREQVIDMAIYAGLFSAESGREAKWEAIKPALIRWEDEGKITAWLGGMYQINPLKFPNLR